MIFIKQILLLCRTSPSKNMNSRVRYRCRPFFSPYIFNKPTLVIRLWSLQLVTFVAVVSIPNRPCNVRILLLKIHVFTLNLPYNVSRLSRNEPSPAATRLTPILLSGRNPPGKVGAGKILNRKEQLNNKHQHGRIAVFKGIRHELADIDHVLVPRPPASNSFLDTVVSFLEISYLKLLVVER